MQGTEFFHLFQNHIDPFIGAVMSGIIQVKFQFTPYETISCGDQLTWKNNCFSIVKKKQTKIVNYAI